MRPLRSICASLTCSRSKLAKYTPGKKSALGDKAALRQDTAPRLIDYDRAPPGATRALTSREDYVEQARRWNELLESDPVLATANGGGGGGARGDEMDED